jgi:hypothetical protein
MNHHCRFGIVVMRDFIIIVCLDSDVMNHHCRFGFVVMRDSLSDWIRCYERFIIGLDSLL